MNAQVIMRTDKSTGMKYEQENSLQVELAASQGYSTLRGRHAFVMVCCKGNVIWLFWNAGVTACLYCNGL